MLLRSRTDSPEARPTMHDMQRTWRLPVASVIDGAGVRDAVWIADAANRELVCFSSTDATLLHRVSLDGRPLCLAASERLLALGTADGMLRGLDPGTGTERFRAGLGADPVAVRVRGDAAWVVLSDGTIARLDGPMARRFSLQDAALLAVGRDHPGDPSGLPPGSAFVLAGGALVRVRPDGTEDARAAAPDGAGPLVVMTFCANALWASTRSSLLLCDPITLALRATFPASEAPGGPIEHLICNEGGRLIGAGRGVFVMNPAADEMFRALPVAAASPIRALASSGTTLWAIESAAPVVHIIDVV